MLTKSQWWNAAVVACVKPVPSEREELCATSTAGTPPPRSENVHPAAAAPDQLHASPC